MQKILKSNNSELSEIESSVLDSILNSFDLKYQNKKKHIDFIKSFDLKLYLIKNKDGNFEINKEGIIIIQNYIITEKKRELLLPFFEKIYKKSNDSYTNDENIIFKFYLHEKNHEEIDYILEKNNLQIPEVNFEFNCNGNLIKNTNLEETQKGFFEKIKNLFY